MKQNNTEASTSPCGWFVFNNGQLLIEKTDNGYHIPYSVHPPTEVPVGSTIHLIGDINGFRLKPMPYTILYLAMKRARA